MKDLLLETRVMLGEDRASLLEEGYKEAVKDFGESSKPTIDTFRELVKKNQFQGNEKNIDYWRKQGYEKFKSKVMEVEARGSKKSQKRETNSTPHKDAIRVKDTENYEVFQIPSYEASKFMGRFYKNKSTSWCISTDEKKYFNEEYKDSSFYFFIRKEFQGDEFDKVALQLDEDNYHLFWDIADDDYDRNTQGLPSELKTYNVEHFDRIEIPFIDTVIVKGTYELVNGKYNVDGNINMNNLELDEIPIQFGIINGSFRCMRNNLKSLKGCPSSVKFLFDVSENQLTSLEFGPVEVGDYSANDNPLTSLKGYPTRVKDNFNVHTNKLDKSDFEEFKKNCKISGRIIGEPKN